MTVNEVEERLGTRVVVAEATPQWILEAIKEVI
jgi:hypothetical protein